MHPRALSHRARMTSLGFIAPMIASRPRVAHRLPRGMVPAGACFLPVSDLVCSPPPAAELLMGGSSLQLFVACWPLYIGKRCDVNVGATLPPFLTKIPYPKSKPALICSNGRLLAPSLHTLAGNSSGPQQLHRNCEGGYVYVMPRLILAQTMTTMVSSENDACLAKTFCLTGAIAWGRVAAT